MDKTPVQFWAGPYLKIQKIDKLDKILIASIIIIIILTIIYIKFIGLSEYKQKYEPSSLEKSCIKNVKTKI